MKQLLKWVIPVGGLLLIGMWIGLNWNQFPANEEVSIPVVKKQEVKYDTSVNASVESDTVSSASMSDDILLMEEDSINAEIASMEENTSMVNGTDEVMESTSETSGESNKNNVAPVQSDASNTGVASPKSSVLASKKKLTSEHTVGTSNNKISSPDPSNAAEKRKSTSEQTVGTSNKKISLSDPSVAAGKRKVTPEQSATNRNLTPSPRVVVKADKQVKSNKQEVVSAPLPKKQVVYDSYMSKKQIPVDYLVEVDGTYQPAASGKGVGAATFIVYNRSGKNLKKVNMEVQYLGKGNQLLRKLEMPVTNISADGAVSVKVPANTEADRLVYKVLYVSSALGDFYYEPLHVYANALR